MMLFYLNMFLKFFFIFTFLSILFFLSGVIGSKLLIKLGHSIKI